MNALAYLNHGRWVVDCPRDGCPEAHLADSDLFVCANCGLVSKVVIPDEMFAVNEIVEKRPVPQTRNWRPGEPLHYLIEENIAHGLDST